MTNGTPRLSHRIALAALAAVLVGTGAGPAMADASCRQFGRLKSQNSDVPVSITFINRSGAYRHVDWLDFDGRPVNYGSLNPGERLSISTYLSHPWMITNGPGDCVEIIMPSLNQTTVSLVTER